VVTVCWPVTTQLRIVLTTKHQACLAPLKVTQRDAHHGRSPATLLEVHAPILACSRTDRRRSRTDSPRWPITRPRAAAKASRGKATPSGAARQVVRQLMREIRLQVALRQREQAPVGQGDRSSDRDRSGRHWPLVDPHPKPVGVDPGRPADHQPGRSDARQLLVGRLPQPPPLRR
jgi:hypothetical protein